MGDFLVKAHISKAQYRFVGHSLVIQTLGLYLKQEEYKMGKQWEWLMLIRSAHLVVKASDVVNL